MYRTLSDGKIKKKFHPKFKLKNKKALELIKDYSEQTLQKRLGT